MKQKGQFKVRKEFYKCRQELIDLAKNTPYYSIVIIEGFKCMKILYYKSGDYILIWEKSTDKPELNQILNVSYYNGSIEISRNGDNQWLHRKKNFESYYGIFGYFTDNWEDLLKCKLNLLKSYKNSPIVEQLQTKLDEVEQQIELIKSQLLTAV